jgi:hypothetical protein
MSKNALFQERQTLGSMKFWRTRRFVLALFCFAAYFVSEERNRDQEADLFLVVGAGILLISILFIFLTHYRTVVENGSLILTGLWSTKKVKIDLSSIRSTEIVKYSPFMINNPVYNLHKKGTIRFYAYGKYAVKLTDKDGLEYVIGSQDPIEFNNVLKGLIGKNL